MFFTSQKNAFYWEQRYFSSKIGLHILKMVSASKKLWVKEHRFIQTEKNFTAFVSASGNHY